MSARFVHSCVQLWQVACVDLVAGQILAINVLSVPPVRFLVYECKYSFRLPLFTLRGGLGRVLTIETTEV